MYRVKADLMRPEEGASVINDAGEEVMRCESLQQAAVVRNALNSELAAAEKRVKVLEAALRDIIEMNPRPTLPYGHEVNDRARAALKGES